MRRACTTFERVAADGTRRSFFSCCVCEWLICPVIYKARQIMVLEKSRTIPSLYVDTFLSTARLRLVAVRCDVGLKCDGIIILQNRSHLLDSVRPTHRPGWITVRNCGQQRRLHEDFCYLLSFSGNQLPGSGRFTNWFYRGILWNISDPKQSTVDGEGDGFSNCDAGQIHGGTIWRTCPSSLTKLASAELLGKHH